jgi:hypothetical protein
MTGTPGDENVLQAQNASMACRELVTCIICKLAIAQASANVAGE